jgi:leucyl-tRNA synthetase
MNPGIEYVKASVNGEVWIVAKNAVEKIGQQAKNVKIVESVSADSLIHQFVQHPLELSQKIPILSASFVSAEKGTGVVYSVPGHAPWDYAALKEAQAKNDTMAIQLTPKYIISTPGFAKMDELFAQNQNPTLQHKETLQRLTEEVYKKEFYEGTMNSGNGMLSNMPVQKAKEKIIQTLDQQNKHDKLYEPSRRAFTRAGNPVSVAILEDQWFLDYSSPQWKKKTQALLSRMNVYPEHFRKAISDSLNWLEKRPCIRKRGLGTPFPFADEWMIEPLSDSTIYMLFYIMIPHIKNGKINSNELDDAFFDATVFGKRLPGNDPRSTIAQKIHEETEYWYPNDWRHTAPAHISNHISFFLFTHTQLLEEKYWPKALSFNEMLVRNGVKMSKSKGNVIPLQHAVRDYGADLMRLFIVSSAGFDRVADWRDNQVPQVRKKMEELELTVRMAIASTNTQHSPETEWLVETLRVRLGETYAHYEKMEFMMAAQKAFFETLNEIKRFKKVFGMDETPAVKHVLNEWLILLSPVTPFLGEELWELAHPQGFTEQYTIDVERKKAFQNDVSFVSTQTLKKPVGNPDKETEMRVQFIESVLLDIERVKKLVKGKQIKTGYVYSVDEKETNWLTRAQTQLFKYAQVEIKINDSHDPLGKKTKAQKGRPALYFE